MVFRSFPATRRNPGWVLCFSVLVALSVMCLSHAAFAADGVVYYADGRQLELEAAKDYVTIEMSRDVPRSKIAADLATKGMPTLVSPSSYNPFGKISLVPIGAAGGNALATLRSTNGVVQARKLYRDPATKRFWITTDRMVVRFKDGVSQAERNESLSSRGLKVIRSLSGMPTTLIVQVIDPAGDAVQSAADLHTDAKTVYCQPDFVADIRPAQITDEFYANQWHLNNTGQNGATRGADINWPEAREVVPTLGQGVQVAIHDGGINHTHEDLAAAYVTGWDFWDGDPDPSPSPPPPGYSLGWDLHGTAVSGVALARINGIGVVGSAPAAGLIGLRWGLFDSDIADAFLFAMANNADVINNSWGGPSQPADVVRDAIQQVATNGRDGRGMVVIFASHNFYTTIALGNPIAGLPGVIAIGASNSFDRRSRYSNWGPELCVVAPSSDDFFVLGALGITTTDIEDSAGLYTNGYNEGGGLDIYGFPDLLNANYTQNFGGTSSSAPLVTGVVALILDANPGLTGEKVRRVLEHTADLIDPTVAQYDLVTGHSETYGYGRVNAEKAAKAAVAAATDGNTWPPPVSDLKQIGVSTISMTWRNPTEAEEFASAMIVHSTAGEVTWTPDGMRDETPSDYSVGQFVAPQVQIVRNDAGSSNFTADPGPGTHHYAVFVRNEANRWSWGRSISTNLSGKSSPMASVAATPRTGKAPLTVDFSGGALDPDLENVEFKYSWNFGDGTSVTNQRNVSHTFNSPGDYLAKLTVTDETDLTGEALVMIRVLDKPNQSPTARISLSPGDGEAPHTVLLQASAIDSDGTVEQYAWKFGDGTVAAGQIVEHTYITPGAYTITLEVVDNQGASAQAAVAVSVWSDETGSGTAKEPGDEANAETQLCGTCGTAGLPSLIAAMLGWGLLSLRRR